MAEPAFNRHQAEREINRALARSRYLLLTKIAVFLFSILAVTLVLMWYVFYYLPLNSADHIEWGPLRHTTGEIIGFRSGWDGRLKPAKVVRMEDGRVVDFRSSEPFFQGQKVKIFYRTGAKGGVYIDRLEPIRENGIHLPR